MTRAEAQRAALEAELVVSRAPRPNSREIVTIQIEPAGTSGSIGLCLPHAVDFPIGSPREGDSFSKRVYKPGGHDIAYGGEKVRFHRANPHQDYIKTSECLRDYVSRLRPEDDAEQTTLQLSKPSLAEWLRQVEQSGLSDPGLSPGS